MTTTDGAIRGTAAGLLDSINSFKFIVCLELLTPVMEAVNNVSEALQSSSSDILNAQSQLAALSAELARLYVLTTATLQLSLPLKHWHSSWISTVSCPLNVSASYHAVLTTTRQHQLLLCRYLTSPKSVSTFQSLIDYCLS